MNKTLIAVMGNTDYDVEHENCDVIYLCDTPNGKKYIISDYEKMIYSALDYAKKNKYEYIYFMSSLSKLLDNTIKTNIEWSQNVSGSFSDFYVNADLHVQHKRIEYLLSLSTDVNVGHNALFRVEDFNPPEDVSSLDELVRYGKTVFNHIPIPTYIME